MKTLKILLASTVLFLTSCSNNDDNKLPFDSLKGIVSTLAGSIPGDVDAAIGSNAQFNNLKGICNDNQGNSYIVDLQSNKIKKITPSGVVSTFAGSVQGDENGTGTNAKFDEPWAICIDLQGNLYVSDSGNYKIKKITPAGIVRDRKSVV